MDCALVVQALGPGLETKMRLREEMSTFRGEVETSTLENMKLVIGELTYARDEALHNLEVVRDELKVSNAALELARAQAESDEVVMLRLTVKKVKGRPAPPV